MSKESNFTQELILPSQGFLNPEIPEGKVVQRCMMVADQKFLSGSNHSANKALKQLIQRTTTSPSGFDVESLTLADTLYLLFKLRSLSYGDTYKFKTRCPECGKKIDITVDLSDLPVNTLEEGYTDDLVVTLPNTGDTVYIKLLTNGDLEAIESELKRRKKRSNNDDESGYILRIVYSIDKIVLKNDAKELSNPIDIERYIGELTDLDASTITASRDKVSYGLDPIIEYTCPECKEYIDVSINFSGDFFRPTIIR